MNDEFKEKAKTYEQSESDIKGMAGRPVRKLLEDYLNPFGEKQNQFNNDIISLISDLENKLNKLSGAEKQKDSALISFKKEFDTVRLRSKLNSKQIEKMNISMNEYEQKAEDLMLNIKPELRATVKDFKSIDASILNLQEKTDDADNCKNDKELFEKKLKELESYSYKIARNEFRKTDKCKKSNVAVIYFADSCAEKSKHLYKLLDSSSIYNPVLIFAGDKESKKDGEVLKTNQKNIDNLIIDINPCYCVLCTEDVTSILNYGEKLLTSHSLILISGEDAFESLNENNINELRYLNDIGLHHYYGESQILKDKLDSKGFKSMQWPDKTNIISAIEKDISNTFPAKIVSLNQWEAILHQSGEHLAKAYGEVKAKSIIIKDKSYMDKCIDTVAGAYIRAEADDYFREFNPNILETDWDYFENNNDKKYDCLISYGYLKYFTYSARRRMYLKIHENLAENGLLIIDAPNSIAEMSYKSEKGWENFSIFESSWLKDDIIYELEHNGFKIKHIIPVCNGIYGSYASEYKNEPVKWVISAVRQ